MLHMIVVVLLFFLMILAPCLVAYRSRLKGDQPDPQDLPQYADDAYLPYQFDLPASESMSAVDMDLDPAYDLTDMEHALAALQMAQAVAQRANAGVRDALARVAAMRAQAAAQAAREAEARSAEADRLAISADQAYREMLAVEVHLHQEQAAQDAVAAELRNNERKAA